MCSHQRDPQRTRQSRSTGGGELETMEANSPRTAQGKTSSQPIPGHRQPIDRSHPTAEVQHPRFCSPVLYGNPSQPRQQRPARRLGVLCGFHHPRNNCIPGVHQVTEPMRQHYSGHSVEAIGSSGFRELCMGRQSRRIPLRSAVLSEIRYASLALSPPDALTTYLISQHPATTQSPTPTSNANSKSGPPRRRP